MRSLARALAAACLAVSCLAAAPRWSPTVSAETYRWPLTLHFYMPPITFSADGRLLAAGVSIGEVIDACPLCVGRLHVWDLRSGRRVFASAGKMARVLSIVFSPDGQYVITGHGDGTVQVWSTADYRIVSRFSCCRGTWIRALALSPDGRRLAIGAQDGDVVVWNMADDISNRGEVRISRSLAGHVFGVSSLAFDESGTHLMSSADDQHVRRWDVQTGASYEFSRAPNLFKAHRGMVKSVITLNGGRQALTGAYWEGGTTKDYQGVAPPDHILRLWDVDTGRPIRSYPLEWGIRGAIQPIDGHSLVAFLRATTWDEAPVLEIFNLDTGKVERKLTPSMGETFHSMAMRPDAGLFVIAIGDGHFLLWNREADKPLAQMVSADEGWAVLAADGRIDFSDGFSRWPCAYNVRQACAGGTAARPVAGLLAALVTPR